MEQKVKVPRYPSVSLRDAERLARMIFDMDGMNAVDRESAVQHMGYSSLNGASVTLLASLKQYGFTVGVGKGTVQLTPLALDVMEPESDEDRVNALFELAFKPEVFSSLRERFPDQVPSESNLRAHLLRQHFSKTAVKAVVPAYLETCEYVTSLKEPESHGEALEDGQEAADTQSVEVSPMHPTPALPTPPVAHSSVQAQASAATHSLGVRRMVFDTDEGEAMFTFPDALSSEAVDDLEEWFELVTKRLRRSAKKAEGAKKSEPGPEVLD